MKSPQDAEDPKDIVCWQRIDARITTSGRLVAGDAARLAALGIGTVINLALTESPGALAGEAAIMRDAGLTYVHIPVPFDSPGDDHFVAFAQAMAGADTQAVHIHCIMNWRVSAFLCRWHRSHGMPPAAADAIMRLQWNPSASDHKDAPAWVKFIEQA